MTWRKLGHIFSPSGEYPWALSHAANPVAEHIDGNLFRIYFSTRNEKNYSSIGSIEIDITQPQTILKFHSKPVLSPGDLGMPDDCGVSIGCILPVGKRRYLYYMGWNLTVTVPWKNTIGLAVSEHHDSPFERFSKFPIINLDEIDPYTISYPWVRQEGTLFRMWYGSNLQWGPEQKDMLHVIKYAESQDGIHWERPNHIAIDSTGPQDYAICKPCLMKDSDGYKMWYCHRGIKYRIGYAESEDGIHWVRKDDCAGIDVSSEGWDSEMIEYPFVFDHNGNRYMLYAGNGFGKTGFGIAVLDD